MMATRMIRVRGVGALFPQMLRAITQQSPSSHAAAGARRDGGRAGTHGVIGLLACGRRQSTAARHQKHDDLKAALARAKKGRKTEMIDAARLARERLAAKRPEQQRSDGRDQCPQAGR